MTTCSTNVKNVDSINKKTRNINFKDKMKKRPTFFERFYEKNSRTRKTLKMQFLLFL